MAGWMVTLLSEEEMRVEYTCEITELSPLLLVEANIVHIITVNC